MQSEMIITTVVCFFIYILFYLSIVSSVFHSFFHTQAAIAIHLDCELFCLSCNFFSLSLTVFCFVEVQDLFPMRIFPPLDHRLLCVDVGHNFSTKLISTQHSYFRIYCYFPFTIPFPNYLPYFFLLYSKSNFELLINFFTIRLFFSSSYLARDHL